jgi:hypothetical protein
MAHNHEHDHNHDDLLSEVAQRLEPILKGSSQAIYVYLDDSHIIYNDKFSSLLGYTSVKEVMSVKETFLDAFVDPSSQEDLVSAYGKSMEEMAADRIDITWKKKNGDKVKSKVIILPYLHEGHLLALHFIY